MPKRKKTASKGTFFWCFCSLLEHILNVEGNSKKNKITFTEEEEKAGLSQEIIENFENSKF